MSVPARSSAAGVRSMGQLYRTAAADLAFARRRFPGDPVVGSSFVVRVGAVAHGGFCVARHEGRVIFVRHTLPGELVRVSVTEGKANSSYWRADAVEVVEPAAWLPETPNAAMICCFDSPNSLAAAAAAP